MTKDPHLAVHPVPQSGDSHRISYTDQPSKLAKIILTNALLMIPTLGFYRFWAKTKVRRHFWSSIKLDGDALEYTGTGKELLIGFLIAATVFIPIIVVIQILQYLAVTDPDQYGLIAAVVNFSFIILLVFLVYFAFFTARRYRMSRTLWRGIRGGLDGSGFVYALRCVWALFLTSITAGIAGPYAEMPALRYIIKNSRFGTQRFDAPSLSGGPLMKRWLVYLFCLFVFFGALIIYAVMSGMTFQPAEETKPPVFLGVFFLIGLPGFIVLNLWYGIYRIRYITSQIIYGPVRFASGITTGSVLWIGFIYLLAFIGMLLAVVLAVSVLASIFSHPSGGSPIVGAIIIAGAILAFIGISIIVPLLLIRPLLKRFIETMVMVGKIDFSHIGQAARGPGRGEGLADILDVGGF
ncbi:MAG: DUF898 family protein [Alphaproteobacteria bacterium]